jgi:anti-sigma B factor antagonist
MTEFHTEPQADDAAVIRPSGRLNLVAAPRLRALVNDSVAAGRPRVVIDLSDTEFMDSSGLGALIAGLKSARQAGGDLRIAGVGPQARMVLELTSMDRVLRAHASVADALDAG